MLVDLHIDNLDRSRDFKKSALCDDKINSSQSFYYKSTAKFTR